MVALDVQHIFAVKLNKCAPSSYFCISFAGIAEAKSPPPSIIKDLGLNYTHSLYGKEQLNGIEVFYDRFEQSHWEFKRYQSIGLEYQFHLGHFASVGVKYAISPVRPIHIGKNSNLFPLVSLKASYYDHAGSPGLNLKPEFGLLFHNGQERFLNFRAQISYGYDMGRRFYTYSFTDGIGHDHDYFGHSSFNTRVGIALNISKLNNIDLGKQAQASPRFDY